MLSVVDTGGEFNPSNKITCTCIQQLLLLSFAPKDIDAHVGWLVGYVVSVPWGPADLRAVPRLFEKRGYPLMS